MSTKKTAVKSSAKAEAKPFRSAEQRIVKLTEGRYAGAYLIKPRNPESKAMPQGPFKGECEVTGEPFVYFAASVKDQKTGAWLDPVFKIHPEVLKKRLVEREQREAELGADLLSSWGA